MKKTIKRLCIVFSLLFLGFVVACNNTSSSTSTSSSSNTTSSSSSSSSSEEHNHNYLKEEVSATCESGGYTIFTCKECNHSYKENVVEALGHNYGDLLQEKLASCEENGEVAHYHCSRCEKNFDVDKKALDNIVIPSLGHDLTLVASFEETCDKEGNIEHYHCSRCNQNFDENNNKLEIVVIKPFGHKFGEWVMGKYPTCQQEGHLSYYECEVCKGKFDYQYQLIEDIVLPISDHNYGELNKGQEATCFNEGRIDYYECNMCYQRFDENHNPVDSITTPTLPHTPMVITGSDPTCDGHGYTDGEVCSVCNASIVPQQIIPSLGHDYGELHPKVLPTCVLGGNVSYYECNRCHLYFDENKNQINDYYAQELGHDLELISHMDPTCTSKGYDLYKCKRCNEEIYDYTQDLIPHTYVTSFNWESLLSATFTDKCSCGSSLEYGYATMSNEVTLAPTYTEEGILEFTATYEYNGQTYTDTKTKTLAKYTEGLEFVKNEEGTAYYVVGIGTCTSSIINIPSVHEGLPVTGIKSMAFSYLDHLYSVTVPSSIEFVEEKAFYECVRLVEIINHSDYYFYVDYGQYEDLYIFYSSYDDLLAESKIIVEDGFVLNGYYQNEDNSIGYSIVDYIGENKDIEISNKINDKEILDIHEFAFYELPIESLKLHDLTVYSYAFYKSNLKSIEFVGEEAFTHLSNSIYIFAECDNLTDIITNGLVDYFGPYMFNGCDSLSSLTLDVENLDDGVFENCSNLKSVTFVGNENLNFNIGIDAFLNCTSLDTLEFNLNGGSISFEEGAFRNNKSLVEIDLSNLNVNSLGVSAFENCTSLSEVKLPSTISIISERAFKDCASLQEITIPSEVENLESKVFENCQNLTTIIFEENSKLSCINKDAFKNCYLLQTITIPNEVNLIGSNSFENCYSLKTITIPENIRYINEDAFASTNIEEVYFNGSISKWVMIEFESLNSNPAINRNIKFYNGTTYEKEEYPVIEDGVTKIGQYSLAYNKDLKEITLPTSLEEIGDSAFLNTYSLEVVKFKENNTVFKNVDYNAFSSTGLRSINLPSSVESIGARAFYNVNVIDYGYLENLKTIGNSAFLGNSNLLHFIVPASIEAIDNYAFSSCSKLYVVTNLSGLVIEKGSKSNGYVGANALKILKENVEPFIHQDGCIFLLDEELNTLYLVKYDGQDEDVVIPSFNNQYNIIIKSKAFLDNQTIRSVVISEGITTLEAFAFSNCHNLNKVTLYSTVSEIQDDAFLSCERLYEVVNLTTLQIEEKLSTYGSVAFYAHNVYDSLDYEAQTTYNVDDFIFKEDANGITLIDYIGSETELVLPSSVNGVTSYIVGGSVFAYNTLIKKVHIPSAVSMIGANAFQECISLTTVTFDAEIAINEIKKETFKGCSNLKEIILPTSINKIGASAFANCVSLTYMDIPVNVTSVETYAFSTCKALEKVVFLNKDTTIGSSAFSNCDNLKDVTLPASLTTIPDYLFSLCISLEVISLPETVKTINAYAFNYCERLKTIYINSASITISNNAFKNCSRLVEIYNKSDLQLEKGASTNGGIALYALVIYEDTTIPSKVVEVDGFVFIEVDSEYYLIDVKKDADELYLPASYNGFDYILNDYALAGTYTESECKILHISSGVKEIGSYALKNFSIKEIIFEENSRLEKIESNAIYINDLILKLPSSVTTIEAGAINWIRTVLLETSEIPEGFVDEWYGITVSVYVYSEERLDNYSSWKYNKYGEITYN